MKTHFLKFVDEAQAIEQLDAFRLTDESGAAVWAQASVTHALDVVGTIYKPTGAFVEDEEGTRSAVMAPLDGFHVNLATDELPEALIPFSVMPDHPTRVFA